MVTHGQQQAMTEPDRAAYERDRQQAPREGRTVRLNTLPRISRLDASTYEHLFKPYVYRGAGVSKKPRVSEGDLRPRWLV